MQKNKQTNSKWCRAGKALCWTGARVLLALCAANRDIATYFFPADAIQINSPLEYMLSKVALIAAALCVSTLFESWVRVKQSSEMSAWTAFARWIVGCMLVTLMPWLLDWGDVWCLDGKFILWALAIATLFSAWFDKYSMDKD
jgi:hypothetical protein